jgi:lycopene cyclase domain-containing protein
MGISYLGFLLAAVAVPAGALAVVLARRPPAATDRLLLAGTVLIGVLALVYTTPWDNYLIDQGVWHYGDGRVLVRVWLAPLEEYLFILGQTLVVGLWTILQGPFRRADATQTRRDAAIGGACGLAIGLVGLAILSGPRTYLGAILAWAGPVLALQWGVGWRYLLANWRRVAPTVAVPVAYLCVADRVAIALGIWTIAPATRTGLTVGGLPIEEGLFFLLTTLFVVQGLVLLPWVLERLGWWP